MAVDAIETRLARATAVDSLSEEDIQSVLESFGVSIQDVEAHCAALYQRLAEWQVSEHPEDGLAESSVAHLRRLLNLPDSLWVPIHEELASRWARQAIQSAMSSSHDERATVQVLKEQLVRFDLPDSRYSGLMSRCIVEIVASEAENMVADGVVTPDEEERLVSLAAILDVKTDQLPATLRASLEEAKRDWALLYGPISPCATRVMLANGETCVVDQSAEELVQKAIRLGTGYTGLTSRVRIMRGLYWRSGVFAHTPITVDRVVSRDSGRLLLTDQRLLFVGQKKSISIPLQQIVEVIPYSDGIEIRRGSGAHLLFRLGGDGAATRRCHVLLSRLLNGDEVDVARPSELPVAYKLLVEQEEALALAIHRSTEEITIEFTPRPGSSLNLDDCRALVFLATFHTIRALLSGVQRLSDEAVVVYVASADEARYALATREGEPRPESQVAPLLGDNRKVDSFRTWVRKAIDSGAVGGDLSSLKELVAVCKRARGGHQGRKGVGIRKTAMFFGEAMLDLADTICESGGYASATSRNSVEDLKEVLSELA